MRALRISLIVFVVLAAILVAVDRIAVNWAEGKAADEVAAKEGLDQAPDVSINGFPFLTQALGGKLDEVEITMDDYLADTDNPDGKGPDKVRIDQLKATMHEVEFESDYSSATAARATGKALISYDELLKAAQAEPVNLAPGVDAHVVGLSDGGNGKIKVEVKATFLGQMMPEPLFVMSTVKVVGDQVKVKADALPDIPVKIAEDRARGVTDFQQGLKGLPAGIHLDKVETAKDGLEVSVKGTGIRLVG